MEQSQVALQEMTTGVKLRTRGFAPRLSDSEVITLEIVDRGRFLSGFFQRIVVR
jgi:hypothetical protein